MCAAGSRMATSRSWRTTVETSKQRWKPRTNGNSSGCIRRPQNGLVSSEELSVTEWRQGAHVWYDIDSPGRGGEERCALVSVAGYERFRLPSEAPEGWAVLGERFAADKGYRGARAVMVWREPGSDTIKIVVIHPDIEPIGLGAVIPYLEPWDA